MKYYEIYVETYHNGEYIDCHYGGATLTEKNLPQIENYQVTWENLDEVRKLVPFGLGFNYWIFKKGRVVSFFAESVKIFNKNTWDIKEWKQELNIEVRVYNKERRATMYDLRTFDVAKVQKYLEEHRI